MELQGNGFKLRTWRAGDAAALQQQANSAKVAAYVSDRFPHPYTIDDAHTFIGTQLNQNPVVNFVIEVDGELAGGIGLIMRDDIHRKTPHIGYWLGEAYWGRGIMTDAAKLLTRYAFENLDVICIQALIFSANLASMRVLEKAGYEKEAVLKGSVIKRDVVMDEHVYSIRAAVY